MVADLCSPDRFLRLVFLGLSRLEKSISSVFEHFRNFFLSWMLFWRMATITLRSHRRRTPCRFSCSMVLGPRRRSAITRCTMFWNHFLICCLEALALSTSSDRVTAVCS